MADAMKYLAHGFKRSAGRVNTQIFNECPRKPTMNIIIHQYRVNIIELPLTALRAAAISFVTFEEDISNKDAQNTLISLQLI
jgi:hypothetical protein